MARGRKKAVIESAKPTVLTDEEIKTSQKEDIGDYTVPRDSSMEKAIIFELAKAIYLDRIAKRPSFHYDQIEELSDLCLTAATTLFDKVKSLN